MIKPRTFTHTTILLILILPLVRPAPIPQPLPPALAQGLIAGLTLFHAGIIAYAVHQETQEDSIKYIGIPGVPEIYRHSRGSVDI